MLMYAWRNKGLFALIVFFLLAGILADKLVPYAFSKLVGLFGTDVSFADIKTSFILCFILMILCKILAEVFGFLKDYFTKVKFEPLVFQQLNADLFLYLSKHSVNFFANNMAGALANKSYALASTTADFYGASLYYIFSVLQLVFTFFMFLFVDVRFAFAFLLALAISLAVFIHIGRKSINLRAKMAETRNKLAGNMIDALQNNFFVRIFNGFSHESSRALKLIREETNVSQKSVTIESCLGDGQRLYFGIFYILMLLYGFQLWKTNQIDNAQLVLVFLLLKDVIMYIFIVIQRAVTFSGVVQEIRTNLLVFATPHDVEDIENAKVLKIKNGQIDFKHITFGYEENHPIFEDFSLTIEPKQKIGIVGMSGSGKSSLINLIQRFYDIQKGEITIDGQNISTITQQSLHENISYIAQTTTLFERSIAENIAYGKPNATQKQIIDAAKKAYAHEFILGMSNKYNTLLSGGNQLSGGQKQRLSIARALLKDAPILILDEATSALDSESEAYIQQAIEKMIKNKTVIAVAHRLSTLKNMDRIIVLEHGKIIEDGTPRELLKKNGAFAKFWKLQQLEENKHE